MKLKSIILLGFILLAGTSCNEKFLDVNTNPNSLPTALPNFVFTNAVNTTASNMVFSNETGSYWSGQWSQSNSYIVATTTFGYNFTNGDFNYWDGFYNNLNDYQFVIDNAEEKGQKFLKGPARVMKSYVIQQLVDMYGNIPYSDAFKGVKSLAPKFDDQKVIYDELIKELDLAIVDLKANAFAGAFTSSDIVANGNITKWVKFANSLKLRILMRESRVASKASFISAELNKIVAEKTGFLETEDVASGGPSLYLATAGKQNPVYERWGYNSAGATQALGRFPRMSQFLVNSLKESGDTLRLKRIAYAVGGENTGKPGVSTKAELAINYAGVPFGASSGFLATAVCPIGPSILTKGAFNKAFILMTAAEVQLNLAEAKLNFPTSSLPGTDKEYFEKGLAQSFRVLGAGTGSEAFKGSKIQNYDYEASTDKNAAIAIQKWIALCNFNGLEAWSEYRKSGLPVTPQSRQVTDAKRPVRLYYPNTESGSNGENVKAQGEIDVFKTKIFWDID
jgi:Starch-binding associating with outer membrane